MVDVIPANPKLKRKALNFRRGQPLQPTAEFVTRLQGAITASQKDIILDFNDRIIELREAIADGLKSLQGLVPLMSRTRDQVLEIKGLGEMIGYPLLTDYARSLDHFLRDQAQFSEVQVKYVSLGVDAIYYVLRNKISGPGGEIEQEVARALRDGVPRMKKRSEGKATSPSVKVWQRIAQNTARLEKAMRELDPASYTPVTEPAKPKTAPSWRTISRDEVEADPKEPLPTERSWLK